MASYGSNQTLQHTIGNRFPNHQLNRLESMQTLKQRSKKSMAWTESSDDGWRLMEDFGKRTTIHGLGRLLAKNSRKHERYIWLVALAFALLIAIYVGLILSDRFNEGRFQTVVHNTRYPIFNIVFPTVTICNANRLNWQRLNEAKQLFLPNETSKVKLQLFEDIVSTYDGLQFGGFDAFESLRGKPLELLNSVNFSLVADFMAWRCNEMLSNCSWQGKSMDCCEIFSKRRTKSGYCWSFNTLETDEGRQKQKLDDLYPWRSANSGTGSGLNARVLVKPENHFPKRRNKKGIQVMICEPLVWHKDFMNIPMNTKTMIEIEAILFYHDNDTRSTPSSQRECVFNNEQNSDDFKSLLGYIYMIENCQAECHQEYLVRYCNCTMDLFFPPGQYKSCQAEDLLCLADHNKSFKHTHQPGTEEFIRNDFEGMVCRCFRNCRSLRYIADMRPSFLSPDIHQNKSYIDLDIHFRFDTMMMYRTTVVFSWVDLMVAFGGIGGLFLGCSVISFIELLHFVFIQIPKYLMQRQRSKSSQVLDIQTNDSRILTSNDQLERFVMKSWTSRPLQQQNWTKLIPRNGRKFQFNINLNY